MRQYLSVPAVYTYTRDQAQYSATKVSIGTQTTKVVRSRGLLWGITYVHKVMNTLTCLTIFNGHISIIDYHLSSLHRSLASRQINAHYNHLFRRTLNPARQPCRSIFARRRCCFLVVSRHHSSMETQPHGLAMRATRKHH